MTGLAVAPSFDIRTIPRLVQVGVADRGVAVMGPVLPTGIAALDACLPGGGLPLGRLTEISGPAAAGKLSLALAAASRVLARGEAAALVDPTATVLPDVWRDPALERLLVVRGGGLAAAFSAVDALLRSNAFPLVVFDLPQPAATLRPRSPGQPTTAAFVRLAHEARVSGTALLVLRESVPGRADGLAPLASLRLEVRPQAGLGHARPCLEIVVTKSRLGGGEGARALLEIGAAA